MKDNHNHAAAIWVIEVKENGVWYPTAGAHTFRSDAKNDKSHYWKPNFPDAKFRVRLYVREE